MVSGSSLKFQFDEFVALYHDAFDLSQRDVRHQIKTDLKDFNNRFWNDQRGLAAFMTEWFKTQDDDGSLLEKAIETAKIGDFEEMRRSLIEVLMSHSDLEKMREGGQADPAQFSKTRSPFFRLILNQFPEEYVDSLSDDEDLIAVKPGAYTGHLRHDSGALAVFRMLLLQGVSWTQTKAFLDLSEPEQADCMEAVGRRQAYHTAKVKLDFWVRRGDWPPEDGGMIRREVHDRITSLLGESQRASERAAESESEMDVEEPAVVKEEEEEEAEGKRKEPEPSEEGETAGKRQHIVNLGTHPAATKKAPAKAPAKDTYMVPLSVFVGAVFLFLLGK